MFKWVRLLKRGEKYDLSSIMGLASPEGTYSERVQWIEQLVDWLRHENQTTRVKFLVQMMDRNPEWREKTGKVIANTLLDSKLTRLFSECGVASSTTITHEFMRRFLRVFLPSFSDDQERSGKEAFSQIFYEDQDAVWVNALPAEVWRELVTMLAPYIQVEKVRHKIAFEMFEASLILSMKCGSIMVREDFSVRAPELGALANHPALNLQNELLKIQEGKHELKALESYLEQLDAVSTIVRNHLEKYGVSIDLVFQRECLKQYIIRIRYLTYAAETLSGRRSQALMDSCGDVQTLFIELVAGSAMDQDFSHLIRKNLSLVSKKVVDFTGSTGDHYIARTPLEMKKLFWGAVGGGVITAFAVQIKYGIDRTSWPIFLDFYYASINYCIAFLVIHFLHFTLATKQPSMTAATLANKIHTRSASGKDDEDLALEIKRLFRSQAWSIFGNLIAVIPGCVLIDQVWSFATGHHFYSDHEAEHLIQSVSPWRSGAVLYAAMTGGLLWLGGISSGWIENAAVYHRIPKLIENHKVLRKFLGVKITTALSKAFLKNVAGVTSSISLGILLGAWPMIGRFFGLPFDIRHVTFSAGSTAGAISSLGASHLNALDWFEVILGISLIGAFNLLISFLLAVAVAVKAKEIPIMRAIAVLRRLSRVDHYKIIFLVLFLFEMKVQVI
jgi:site-specific recombinase